MSLPAPGSPTFIPALIDFLQAEISAGGEEWSVDPTLLSSLLLSQIVGPEQGGVIVDVLPSGSEGKSEGIAKVAECVQAISRGIFGRTTHHIHLSRHTHPSDLPYALFLDPDKSWPNTHTHPSSPPISASRRPSRRSTISTPSSKYTSALPSPIFPRSYLHRGSRTPTPGVTPGITPKNSYPLLNGNLEPRSEYGFGPPLVPHCVGYPDHPHGQSVERLHDGEAADKQPSLPQCLVISGLERAESPVWGKLADILLKGYVELPPGARGIPGQNDVKGEMPNGDASLERWDLPEGFWVIWVREEDRSEKCPSWLVDHFSCSACVHPDDLVSPPNLPLRPIIPPSYITSLMSLRPYTHIHPPLHTHISNLFSALSVHPHLRSNITGRAALVFPEYVRAHRLVSAPYTLPKGWERGVQARRKIRSSKDGLSRKMGIGLKTMKVEEEVVDSWGILAGEEPSLANLGEDVKVNKADEALELEGDEGWDLDVELGNIHSVFALALRHRIGWRAERDQIMYLVKGSATPGGGGSAIDGKMQKEKRRERRRRREVDVIMEQVLAVV